MPTKRDTQGVNSKVTKPPVLNKKLPLARVKKIAKMDEDVTAISNAAAIIIAGATEKFAAYFAEQSFFFTLAEKKKGLSYRHCASAVARLPQLDFLADVVPQTVKFSDTEQGKKLLAKQKNGSKHNDDDIPVWARAHPEALAKLQAAQKEGGSENHEGMDHNLDIQTITSSHLLSTNSTALKAQEKPTSSKIPSLPLILNEDVEMSNA